MRGPRAELTRVHPTRYAAGKVDVHEASFRLGCSLDLIEHRRPLTIWGQGRMPLTEGRADTTHREPVTHNG